MAEANQNQGQAQQTAQGAGTTGQAQQTTNPQNQAAQQTAPPAIDYGKIQQMLDGTLAAKEAESLFQTAGTQPGRGRTGHCSL